MELNGVGLLISHIMISGIAGVIACCFLQIAKLIMRKIKFGESTLDQQIWYGAMLHALNFVISMVAVLILIVVMGVNSSFAQIGGTIFVGYLCAIGIYELWKSVVRDFLLKKIKP